MKKKKGEEPIVGSGIDVKPKPGKAQPLAPFFEDKEGFAKTGPGSGKS